MSSNRGGYATPKNEKTNFIHKAEETINNNITTAFKQEIDKYRRLFTDYQVYLEEAQARMIKLDTLANEIRLDVRENRRLEKQLGVELNDKSRNKLEKQVQLIRRGLLTVGRISIGGRRYSVSRIRELL
jgi:hypothetical protein